MQANACNFIKKRLWHRFFPVNFAQFLRTPLFTEHLRWLLLALGYFRGNHVFWWKASSERQLHNSEFNKASIMCLLFWVIIFLMSYCNIFVYADQRPATLLKKRLWHKCFPVNFARFLRTPFLQSTSGRLLLSVNKFSKLSIKVASAFREIAVKLLQITLPFSHNQTVISFPTKWGINSKRFQKHKFCSFILLMRCQGSGSPFVL